MLLLCIMTVWPTKETKQLKRRYVKDFIWNPDGTKLDSFLWRKVRAETFHNTKKFPPKLMRLSIFTITKMSQRKFPQKRLNGMLHISMGDMLFVKTHCSHTLMAMLWSAPCLSLISNKDTHGKDLHLPHQIKTHRLLSSVTCPVYISDLGKEVANYIRSCFTWLKSMVKSGKFRSYHY